MKNTLLLLAFFLINSLMFKQHFVPNINKGNNIDQIECVLLKVKETVNPNSKIYFLTQTNIQENPEIYYKAQFSLAPRVIVAEKYENIPKSSYMIKLWDKKKTDETVLVHPLSEIILVEENEFFKTTLLKKY